MSDNFYCAYCGTLTEPMESRGIGHVERCPHCNIIWRWICLYPHGRTITEVT